MINIKDFYSKYYSSYSCKAPLNNNIKIFPMLMSNGEYIFGFKNYCDPNRNNTTFYFNMSNPEVYAIDCYDSKYIPLSNNDIDLLMIELKDNGIWESMIESYIYWIHHPDEGCEEDYDISKIPSITVPDYHLIFKNGYTGKEDISMILHEDT